MWNFMTDLPRNVEIHEQGPRADLQMQPGTVQTIVGQVPGDLIHIGSMDSVRRRAS
jgi:hypothetical protein